MDNDLLVKLAQQLPTTDREQLFRYLRAKSPELGGQIDLILKSSEADRSAEPDFNGRVTRRHEEAKDSSEEFSFHDKPTIGGTFAQQYKLREKLGEGGMGIVYVADQTEPIKRRVAIKLIKVDGNSTSIRARFEQERQALALMDHPNIAKVLDAGVYGGMPYFVMELIKGVSLTQYCDDAKLSPRQRLELFIPVCQAVQHAHQKGIIHRDLKPGNILVGLYDGKPIPKIIDFGIAKTTGPKLSDRSIYTEVGSLIGTLEYMSPEQAELNNLDIDTRTDIYALGVILYELLVGTTPFNRRELESAGLGEMLRVIKEVEPQKPSTKLSCSGTLPSIAAVRQMEPQKLASLMKGELDWITMKCLEKERSRRYETANGLALDVQRFLADEPVQAGPPSASYRLKKLLRKYRVATIATGITSLAILIGAIAAGWGFIRATRAEAKAQERFVEAETERKRAVKAEADTLADYRASTDDVIDHLISSKPAIGSKERAYIDKAIQRWLAYADRKGDDKHNQAIRAEGHFRAAALWKKIGETDNALTEYQLAIDAHKVLAKEYPTELEHKRQIARCQSNRGVILDLLGKRELALAEYESAQAIQSELVKSAPKDASYQAELSKLYANLGILYIRQNNPGKATSALLAAREMQLKLVEQHPSVDDYQIALSNTHHTFATFNMEQRHFAEAKTEYLAAIDLQEKLVERLPGAAVPLSDLARSHINLGILLKNEDQFEEAILHYKVSLEIREKLVKQFPSVPIYAMELGGSYLNFGNLLRTQDRPAETFDWYAKAISLLGPLYERDPRQEFTKRSYSFCYLGRAQSHDNLHQFEEANKDWEQALQLTTPAEVLELRATRVLSRLRNGLAEEAIAEAVNLDALANGAADRFYDLACIYSVASEIVKDKQQIYSDQAVGYLAKALKAGFTNLDQLKTDKELDPIRNREDYKALLAERKLP